ncbi:MAG TPA: FG-GAP-like repeat-containing protein, partial [Planctomycetota bacterium]|nr:FG-GAP-like repeat-containing protein [Planctomycetota bacterium]
FTDATASRMPVGIYRTTSLALGDVDGDGDLDLVVGNGGINAVWEQSRLYLNNGTGTFTDVTASRMPAGSYDTTSLALGDVDGDGDLDLVVGNYWGTQSLLYINNGTGTFTDATASRMPAGSYSTTSLALGDVDGDGDLDLVVGNQGNPGGQSLLYLNNGTGTFTDATASRMPVGSYITNSLVLGDMDGDGDLDLVVGNSSYYSGQSLLYLNNGTGTFTDATASRIPAGYYNTNSLALGDVDGDGDLDLVLGNDARPSLLYQNLLRQLDAPYVLHSGRNYQLDIYSRYGPATTTEIAIPFFATGTANIPLPPFGTIGIDPARMIMLPPFLVPQPAGIGSLTIPVPNLPALAGITFYTQVLLDQQPVQARLTNVVGDITLR